MENMASGVVDDWRSETNDILYNLMDLSKCFRKNESKFRSLSSCFLEEGRRKQTIRWMSLICKRLDLSSDIRDLSTHIFDLYLAIDYNKNQTNVQHYFSLIGTTSLLIGIKFFVGSGQLKMSDFTTHTVQELSLCEMKMVCALSSLACYPTGKYSFLHTFIEYLPESEMVLRDKILFNADVLCSDFAAEFVSLKFAPSTIALASILAVLHFFEIDHNGFCHNLPSFCYEDPSNPLFELDGDNTLINLDHCFCEMKKLLVNVCCNTQRKEPSTVSPTTVSDQFFE